MVVDAMDEEREMVGVLSKEKWMRMMDAMGGEK